MDQSQLGGLCYVIAAVLGLVYWRLRIYDDLNKRVDQDDDDDDQ